MDNTIVGIILSTVTCTDGIYLALLLDKYYDNSLPVVTLDNNDDIQEKAEKLVSNCIIGERKYFTKQVETYKKSYDEKTDTCYLGLVPPSNAKCTGNGEFFRLKLENEDDLKITGFTILDTYGKEVNKPSPKECRYIIDALNKLRSNALINNDALHILDDEFRLTYAQRVYERILGKKFLAFRRFISDKVEETGNIYADTGHRPGKLYRLK